MLQQNSLKSILLSLTKFLSQYRFSQAIGRALTHGCWPTPHLDQSGSQSDGHRIPSLKSHCPTSGKARIMRCEWKHILVTRSVLLLCPLLLTGCHSMNGYVMNASGQGYYDKGNYSMAAKEFQQAIASDPGNPDYIANLARTRYKMGDAAGAEQMYRQALTIAPSHQPSYHGMSELMLAQGRGHEASQMLSSWASTQPYVAESHIELAWLQGEMGDKQGAAQSLQRALQVNPSHPTALAHMGQYYHEQGQPTQAMAMYQQSLRANWDQPEVHSRLASASEAVGASHPMNSIAMARGVHPNSLPRQQMAFGRPAMAPQMQMAQAGFMPGMNPGPMSGPMNAAFFPQPGNPGTMTTTFSPQMPPQQAASQPFNHMAAMPFPGPMTPSAAPAMQIPPASPSAAMPQPAPVPDPNFATPEVATTQLPATSVSHTSLQIPGITQAEPSTGSTETPVVEAF
jgi:Tfp pilus assembly protein PilF